MSECRVSNCGCRQFISSNFVFSKKCTCSHSKDEHELIKAGPKTKVIPSYTFASEGWECTRKWVSIDKNASTFTGGVIWNYCSGIHIDYKRPQNQKAGWYPKLFIWDGAEGWSNPKMDEKQPTPLYIYQDIVHALGASIDENGCMCTPPTYLLTKGEVGKVCEALSEMNVLNSNVISIVSDYASMHMVIKVVSAKATQLTLKVEVGDKSWKWALCGDAQAEVRGPYTLYAGNLQKQLELLFDLGPGRLTMLNANGETYAADFVMFNGQPIMRRGRPFLLNTTTPTNIINIGSGGEEVVSLTSSVMCAEGWNEKCVKSGECSNDDVSSISIHVSENSQPDATDGLSQQQCEELSMLWSTDGLAEHASIASFARFTLQLLALGAPSELLSLSQQAGKDEVEHAKLCFQLAQRFGGRAVSPSSFPFPSALQLEHSPEKLARAVVLEGCVCETASLFELVECISHCTDYDTSVALRVMIEDETQHAVLAWKTVLWLLQRGDGDAVKREVASTFEEAFSKMEPAAEVIRCQSWLSKYGKLPVEYALVVGNAASWSVVRPLALRLLESVPILEVRMSSGLLAQQVFVSLVDQIFG